MMCLTAHVPVSIWRNSIGVIMCALVWNLNRQWSQVPNALISLSVMLYQHSLLVRMAFMHEFMQHLHSNTICQWLFNTWYHILSVGEFDRTHCTTCGIIFAQYFLFHYESFKSDVQTYTDMVFNCTCDVCGTITINTKHLTIHMI